MTCMRFEEMEIVYDGLASAIDKAGSGKEAIFLAKLSLVLAHRIGSIETFNTCLEIAQQDLDIEPRTLSAADD